MQPNPEVERYLRPSLVQTFGALSTVYEALKHAVESQPELAACPVIEQGLRVAEEVLGNG